MAAYNGRGEWGFQQVAYALGDVVTWSGLFWRCLTAATTAQPSTNADWAPLANGQLLAAKTYHPSTSATPGVTATSAATAPAFDSTNLALTQAANANMRFPDSGRALVELEGMGYLSVAGNYHWTVLSSTTAGTTFNDPGGQIAWARVVEVTVSDTLHIRRRASFLISGTTGAAFNIYWAGWVSTGTGTLAYGASGGQGPALMKVSAV